MTKFCMVVPQIFGSPVWSLFHVTHLANLGCLLLLENLWTPCQIYSGYLVSCTAVIICSCLSSCKMMCVASVCVDGLLLNHTLRLLNTWFCNGI